jgi:hypothetical protein
MFAAWKDTPRTLNLRYSCARQCPWEPLPRSTSGRSLMLSSFRGRTDQRASRDSTSPGTFCYVDNDRVCLCGLPDRSPTAEASLQDTVLPSIPVFLLDNALHSLHRKIAAACRKRRLLIPSYGTYCDGCEPTTRAFPEGTWSDTFSVYRSTPE